MSAHRIVGAALAVLSGSVWPAAAQQASTYVLSTGRDTGVCPLTTPCRTFRYAITQTAAGGEVIALDVAGYAPFTIDRAITISSGGPGRAYIGASPSGGTAITINAGAGDPVHLRGLQIVNGAVGISVTSAGSLDISDVAVSGMSSTGLNVGAATNVVVAQSIFTRNNVGVNAANGSLVLRDVQISGGSTGVSTAANATFVRCTVESQDTGIRVVSGSAFIQGSTVTQTGRGVQVDSGILRLDSTTITGNTTGVYITGGTANSYGNNNITDSTVGAITQVPRD